MTDGGGPQSKAQASEAGTRPGWTRAAAWWVALAVPGWLVLILCTYWEPVMGDGWGHVGWHRSSSLGWHSLYEFSKEVYLYENPRLGQVFTMLLYSRGPYHVIITPLVELAVVALLAVLALGRWPSPRRSDDALVALVIAAVIAVCVPQIGPLLFYRPFTCNYVYGFALNLLWLLPYRLELAAPRPPRRWLAPVMLVLGLAAGLCNEHTGLAFLAMGLAASLCARSRGGLRLWMIAGLLGLAAGYGLLLEAPGQHVRYLGLADQAGIVGRIVDRGVLGNLRVVGLLALHLAWALPLLVIAAVERRTAGPAPLTPAMRWSYVALAVAGLVCTVTLLGSPKIGPRLYFASIALVGAGLAGWLGGQLRSAWARRTSALIAGGALVYVAARLVAVHAVVGPLAAQRLERLEHGPPGAVVTVPRYPVAPSRYFLGDDFAAPRREALAADYGLKAIELEVEPPR